MAEIAAEADGPAHSPPFCPEDKLIPGRKTLLEKQIGRSGDEDSIADILFQDFCRCRDVKGMSQLQRQVLAFKLSYRGTLEVWFRSMELIDGWSNYQTKK